MKQHIVYQITDSLTNKIYIGSTTTTLDRFKKYWGSGNAIMAEYKKRGNKKDFSKKIIALCESKAAKFELEYHLILKMNATNTDVGYNLDGSPVKLMDLSPKDLLDFILTRENLKLSDFNWYNK